MSTLRFALAAIKAHAEEAQYSLPHIANMLTESCITLTGKRDGGAPTPTCC